MYIKINNIAYMGIIENYCLIVNFIYIRYILVFPLYKPKKNARTFYDFILFSMI